MEGKSFGPFSRAALALIRIIFFANFGMAHLTFFSESLIFLHWLPTNIMEIFCIKLLFYLPHGWPSQSCSLHIVFERARGICSLAFSSRIKHVILASETGQEPLCWRFFLDGRNPIYAPPHIFSSRTIAKSSRWIDPAVSDAKAWTIMNDLVCLDLGALCYKANVNV